MSWPLTPGSVLSFQCPCRILLYHTFRCIWKRTKPGERISGYYDMPVKGDSVNWSGRGEGNGVLANLCVVFMWRFNWSVASKISLQLKKQTDTDRQTKKARNIPGRVKLLSHPGNVHLCFRSPCAAVLLARAKGTIEGQATYSICDWTCWTTRYHNQLTGPKWLFAFQVDLHRLFRNCTPDNCTWMASRQYESEYAFLILISYCPHAPDKTPTKHT